MFFAYTCIPNYSIDNKWLSDIISWDVLSLKVYQPILQKHTMLNMYGLTLITESYLVVTFISNGLGNQQAGTIMTIDYNPMRWLVAWDFL